MKRSKTYLILFIVVSIIFGLFSYRVVNADSGWDSSYDGYYSDSNYGDYGGGNYGNYGGSGYSGSGGIIGISISTGNWVIDLIINITLFLVIGIVSIVNFRKLSKRFGGKITDYEILPDNKYKEMSKKELNKFKNIIDIDYLKEYAYTLFVKLESISDKNNLKSLADAVDENILKDYKKYITNLNNKHHKKIVEDITHNSSKILKIDSNIIDIMLDINCIIYVIEEKNKKILSGTKDKVINKQYLISFEKNNESYILRKIELIDQKEVRQ